ncbi:tetratricopeptide repeat protein [Micromonospora chalcea]|uniref:tetratricopeptide repeat protein n=1 Tax=Micromonospora chalcea TaxID=1874 RepID=UPI003F4A368C
MRQGVQRGPVDPAAIHNQVDLCEGLETLRLRAGLSYEAMEAQADKLRSRDGRVIDGSIAKLGKSTVGEISRGKRLPTREKLLTWLRVCNVSAPDTPTWVGAWQRARTAQQRRPPGAVRVRDAQPRYLGVHPAIRVAGDGGEVPPYVRRDADAELHTVLAAGADRGCFVLLVGGSSAGKTRTLYEATATTLPDWWLTQPSSADDVRTLTVAPTGHMVVWLDELRPFLDGDNGLSAATIRALLRAGAVVVATVWPQWYHAYTTIPDSGEPDLYARQRELLALARVVDIAAVFTKVERQCAQLIAADDPRLRMVLRSKAFGVTQVLAAAPQLMRRWEQAPNPLHRAVITAAVDARRMGLLTPLTEQFLSDAVVGYLQPRELAAASGDWLAGALAYARAKLRGAAQVLYPVASRPGVIDGWEVADYLVEHSGHTRRTRVPPTSAWEAYAEHASNAEDLCRLGAAAEARALLRFAENLYTRALYDSIEARWRLASLYANKGEVDEAEDLYRDVVAAGDANGTVGLALICADYGDADEAEQLWRRAMIDDADDIAGIMLISTMDDRRGGADLLRLWHSVVRRRRSFIRGELVARLGRRRIVPMRLLERSLRRDIAAGDTNAVYELSQLFVEHRRYGDAERVLREAIRAGHKIYLALGRFLVERNRAEEAEQVWREGASAGHGEVLDELAELLERHKRRDEVEELLVNAVDGGLRGSFATLVRAYRRWGWIDEAEQLLRLAVERGNESLRPAYVAVLKQQGRIDEAVHLYKEEIAAGDETGTAREFLAWMLRELGRHDEAGRLLEDGMSPEEFPDAP